jgi:hypothetical protein
MLAFGTHTLAAHLVLVLATPGAAAASSDAIAQRSHAGTTGVPFCPVSMAVVPQPGKVVASCTNRSDCTADLQAALASGAADIRVPALTDPAGPWLVGPLFFPTNMSHATVTFEPGVVVEAVSGELGQRYFKLAGADLFATCPGVRNVTLNGPRATLRMQRADYANSSLYAISEYRSTMYLNNVDGFRLLGLTLEESGGDGLYITNVSRNVVVDRVKLLRHYRNGMSVSGLLTQGVPGVPQDPLHPIEDPLDPLHIGKCHSKRTRTSARTFGSAVRPTAAHWVITPGR